MRHRHATEGKKEEKKNEGPTNPQSLSAFATKQQ
jgi:hypothetical protein